MAAVGNSSQAVSVTITASGVIGGSNIVTQGKAFPGTAATGYKATTGTATRGPVARPGS
jgi:hypothetical protein